MAVHADQRRPEGVRVGQRQRGYAVGEFPDPLPCEAAAQFPQGVRHGIGGGAHLVRGRQLRSAWAIRGNDLTPAALRLFACSLTVLPGGVSAMPSTTESRTLPDASTKSTRTA